MHRLKVSRSSIYSDKELGLQGNVGKSIVMSQNRAVLAIENGENTPFRNPNSLKRLKIQDFFQGGLDVKALASKFTATVNLLRVSPKTMWRQKNHHVDISLRFLS